MDDEAIRRWVVEAGQRGIELARIKEELKNHGYPPELADEILKPKKKPIKITMTAFLLVIVLVSVLGYVLFEKFYMTESRLLKKAESSYSNKEYDKTLSYLKTVLDRASSKKLSETELKRIHIYRKIGIIYYQMGDYPNAKTYFNKELDQNPNDYPIHVLLGSIYYRAGDYNASKTHFEKALEINPNGTRSYRGLGILYRKTEDYPNAKKYLSEAVKYYPNDYEVNFALGSTYYRLGEYGNSYKYLARALSINPDGEEAKKGLEIVSEKLGK